MTNNSQDCKNFFLTKSQVKRVEKTKYKIYSSCDLKFTTIFKKKYFLNILKFEKFSKNFKNKDNK